MSGQPMLKITIPPGLGPGQKLMCKAPDGQQLQVTIPPNVRPGQQIQIAYKPLADQPAARGSQGSTPLDVARMRQIFWAPPARNCSEIHSVTLANVWGPVRSRPPPPGRDPDGYLLWDTRTPFRGAHSR